METAMKRIAASGASGGASSPGPFAYGHLSTLPRAAFCLLARQIVITIHGFSTRSPFLHPVDFCIPSPNVLALILGIPMRAAGLPSKSRNFFPPRTPSSQFLIATLGIRNRRNPPEINDLIFPIRNTFRGDVCGAFAPLSPLSRRGRRLIRRRRLQYVVWMSHCLPSARSATMLHARAERQQEFQERRGIRATPGRRNAILPLRKENGSVRAIGSVC